MSKVRIDKKAQWMAEFEKLVCQAAPEHTGKIKWDSAQHFYNIGKNPVNAAAHYVKVRIA